MAVFVVGFFLYSKGFGRVRTADLTLSELTLRVLAGLVAHNSLVLPLWWHPQPWWLQGGFSRASVQVLVLEELHGNKLEVQVCWGVKFKQQPPEQSAALPGIQLT